MTLGTAIRGLRAERGLNLNQLARVIDQDPSYLSKIERGKIENVSSRLVGKIAEALQVSTDYLYVEAGWLAHRDGLVDPTPAEQRLFDAIRAIPTRSARERAVELFIWVAEAAAKADAAGQQ